MCTTYMTMCKCLNYSLLPYFKLIDLYCPALTTTISTTSSTTSSTVSSVQIQQIESASDCFEMLLETNGYSL